MPHLRLDAAKKTGNLVAYNDHREYIEKMYVLSLIHIFREPMAPLFSARACAAASPVGLAVLWICLLYTSQERLYQEMAFLAYYLHWSNEALMALDHWERRRWCREVSAINKKLSGDSHKSFELR